MSGDELFERVTDVAGLPGVRLTLATDLREGLVICAAGEDADRAPSMAALFAALYRQAAAAAVAHGMGEPRAVRLDCGDDHVLAGATGSTLLVVVAGQRANLGRIRLHLLAPAGTE